MLKGKNIIKQEEEFIKLNEEIDSRTKDLMTLVDQIKADNDKLYAAWEKPECSKPVETPEPKSENEKKEENNSSFISNITDENFLQEYLFRVKNSDSVPNLNQLGNVHSKETKQLFLKNDNLKQSGKSLISLVSTQGEESTLSLGITKTKSDVKLKHGRLESEVIPESLKGVGHDGITRFLTAKVKLLTEQLEIMQKNEKKHLEKIKELQLHKDKSVEERDKLIQQSNMTRNVLIKYEQQSKNVVAQLQTTQAENSHLKKELETLKKEIRQNAKNYTTNELKLNRTLEEIEKLKSSLHHTKQEEKELKEMQRKKTEELSNVIKKLERQRTELLNAFKKQLLIIDNLKRQKALIEAGKLVKSAEEDFINFLDCNPTRRCK